MSNREPTINQYSIFPAGASFDFGCFGLLIVCVICYTLVQLAPYLFRH